MKALQTPADIEAVANIETFEPAEAAVVTAIPGHLSDGDEAGVQLGDFHSYMPTHTYIFAPSGEMWPASSVNARIPPVALTDQKGEPVLSKKTSEPMTISASSWLDKHRAVEQMTWAPGESKIIANRLISEGGWIDRPGANVFNLYRPPRLHHGKPNRAGPWLEHVSKVYPDEADHIIRWLAHRVQRPGEKINHALVLGGAQGIGKDTLLEPVKHAVGPWNCVEVSPQHLLGRFNGFLKSVILRVSEARDLGDVDRFKFYDHLKSYTAAPPDVLRVDEKHLREHAVLNVCGVIITSNYKTDGIFLPADDRRHFVAWSDRSKDDFVPGYWTKIWKWLQTGGGIGHVAAYLAGLDLSGFDPKAPPPKTSAFWSIVDANRAPEDAELADVLDKLGWPDATTLTSIAGYASDNFATFLNDRKNRRVIPHRLEAADYTPIRNPGASDGLWRINNRRQAIYAKKALTERDRIAAASKLCST